MAPLDAALALAERHNAAAVVRENLDLDVPRPLEVFLDVHVAIAEGLVGLAPGGLERPFDLGVIADQTHSLAASPGHGLQHQGIAEALRLTPRLSGIA